MKLFFCHARELDPFSKIIQWVTKSQWTHCGFILDPTLGGEEITAESLWDHGGAVIAFWFPHQWSIFEIYEFESSESDQMDYVRNSVQVRYSYAKILLLAIQLLFGQPMREKATTFLNKLPIWEDAWKAGEWCSEYVASFFFLHPDLLNIEKDRELVWPEDLYQAVKASPKFKLVSAKEV